MKNILTSLSPLNEQNLMSPVLLFSKQSDSGNIYQKGVKHLCENGIEHVPGEYVLPLDERPNLMISHKLPNNDPDDDLNLKLPIIDFAELLGPNRKQVLKSLARACQNYGFFQLVNHGISEDMTSNIVNVSKRFFEIPFTEREKYMSSDMTSPVRYGTSFNQTNDGVFCWRDFLKLVCHSLQDVLPQWPSSPIDFRQLAVSYAKETKLVFLVLVEAILESLVEQKNKENGTKLEEEIESKLKEFQDGTQLMVLNCYPPCPEPDLTLGMPPHSDFGFLTLLLQDEVTGLQIQHQDDWVTLQPVPRSFVVNVGDHLEIFSNGRYKSVLHRVFVNATKHRISVASLHSVPSANMVQPWPELINDKNPRLYKDTDFASFIQYLKSQDSKKKNFLESRKLENK